MKTLFYAILIFLIFTAAADAAKVGTLDEINRPDLMEITHEKLYIVEGSKIYMYDINDLKFEKSFCKKGEGPGELKSSPSLANYIILTKNTLLIVSMDKVIQFSINGNIIKEFKVPIFTNYLYPLGDNNYLALRLRTGRERRADLDVMILDEEMKEVKKLYTQKMSGEQNKIDLTYDGIFICVSKDKIFIDESPLGFKISVYNFKGEKTGFIEQEHDKVKFTEKHKELSINRLKESSVIRNLGWENFKKIVKITNSEYLPLIQDMVIDNNLIYVKTNNIKDNKVEFYVMDFKGNVVKKVYLTEPIDIDFGNKVLGRQARFYKFYKGKYYYLFENDDEECWELHSEDL